MYNLAVLDIAQLFNIDYNFVSPTKKEFGHIKLPNIINKNFSDISSAKIKSINMANNLINIRFADKYLLNLLEIHNKKNTFCRINQNITEQLAFNNIYLALFKIEMYLDLCSNIEAQDLTDDTTFIDFIWSLLSLNSFKNNKNLLVSANEYSLNLIDFVKNNKALNIKPLLTASHISLSNVIKLI